MKARFLLFLLFAILLQVNTSSFAREMKTARRIELRVKAVSYTHLDVYKRQRV